jgi:hypothetical protein
VRYFLRRRENEPVHNRRGNPFILALFRFERYERNSFLKRKPFRQRVKVPWDELKSISCRLPDLFTGAVYERKGEEIWDSRLCIDLEGWGFHFLKF